MTHQAPDSFGQRLLTELERKKSESPWTLRIFGYGSILMGLMLVLMGSDVANPEQYRARLLGAPVFSLVGLSILVWERRPLAGHRHPVQIVKLDGRFSAECACGWMGGDKIQVEEARSEGLGHSSNLSDEIQDFDAAGPEGEERIEIYSEPQKQEFRQVYARRWRLQIVLTVVLVAAVVAMIGMAKGRIGTPWGLPPSLGGLISAAVVVATFAIARRNWRCPACNQNLGAGFNPRYCLHCEVELRD